MHANSCAFAASVSICLPCAAPFTAQQPRGGRQPCGGVRCEAQQQQQPGGELSLDRRTVLGGSLATAAALSLQQSGTAFANQEVSDEWEKVSCRQAQMCNLVRLLF